MAGRTIISNFNIDVVSCVGDAPDLVGSLGREPPRRDPEDDPTPPDDDKKPEFCEAARNSLQFPTGMSLDGALDGLNYWQNASRATTARGGPAVSAGPQLAASLYAVGGPPTAFNFKGTVGQDSPLFEPYAQIGNAVFGAISHEVGFTLFNTQLAAHAIERLDGDSEIWEPTGDLLAIALGWEYADKCRK